MTNTITTNCCSIFRSFDLSIIGLSIIGLSIIGLSHYSTPVRGDIRVMFILFTLSSYVWWV